MHELVLVLSDFYVSQEAPDRELPAGVTLPGFQHVARFATRSELSSGWRPWLSRWLIGADAGATATVAAASSPMAKPVTAISREAAAIARPAPAYAQSGSTQNGPTQNVAWMATPMHLIAGMTSVHVDRRSILRLDAADQTTLAADFQRVFHDSGFYLQPLEAGDFLMLGPEMPRAETREPARALGGSMVQRSDSSIALRRLGAEIEMWLHDHPINDTRRRRGELPVTSLWLWGAGAIPARGGAFPASDVGIAHSGATGHPPTAVTAGDSSADAHSADVLPAATDGAVAFGRDSYLQGLWAMRGAKVAPLPQQLADVFGYPHAQRAVLVIEIGLMLQTKPKWTFFEAVADIDRVFIAPAVEALNRGQYDRLVVLANDYELTLRARDRLKFWRRAPSGLSGLQ